MKKHPIIEGLKEFARIVTLAALPLAATALEAGQLFTKATLITLAVAVLRGVDAYIHQNKSIKANGLLPW